MANTATDPTGRSIITQVAFKGAVTAATATGVYLESVFFEAFPVFKEMLMTEVIAQQEAYFAEAIEAKAARIADGTYQAAGAGTYDVDAAFANEFGATPASGGGVTVKGKQHGPLPEWLAPMAAAKGCTDVYDQRIDTRDGSSVVGTKRPWFKSVSDKDMAFWPPR
jgi:hypothetical protein